MTFLKFIVGAIFVLCLWTALAQRLLFKNRLSDQEAHALFLAKKVNLHIYDTVIKNHHLHYAVAGNDSLPVLVFIHGSPGSWSNYRTYMWDPALLAKYRIVAIDRPGFGYSDFGNALHLQDQCALILPVLQKLKNDKPLYVCGHSMGVPVAVQLAADAPGLISTLILVGSPLDVNLEEKETWRKLMEKKPLYWALPGAFGPSNTELLYLKKDLIGLQKEFEKVTANIYFIHGDKDNWVPIENIAYGKKMLVNAKSIRCDTIRGAGHYIPWKNRDVFRKLLYNVK